MILRSIILIFVLVGTIGAAHAEDIDTESAARFIKSMAAVNAYADQMETESRAEFFNDAPNPVLSGEFNPYSSGVKMVKEQAPVDYKEISNIVKAYGFTLNDWATTGDRMLAAYLAIEVGNSPEFAGIADMDPAMLETMPPQARLQFAGMQKTLEKIKVVPASDKEALRANIIAYKEVIDFQNE